ncbi:MAG: DUF5913 domain-containing protein, partial [Moraxellaceae bacterium]|nr:DUF5913 domain-containing protein [Moraxellaceae bacterium]
LNTGQTVEIITAPGARPNPAWLDFAVTSRARTRIRHFLKHQQQSESHDLGMRLLNKTLSSMDKRFDDLPDEDIQRVLQELNLPDSNTMLEAIGMGNLLPQIIARRLIPGSDLIESKKTNNKTASKGAGIAIRGTEGLVVSYARCCWPLPGDQIMGHLSAGRGIVIHRYKCQNMAAELRNSPDKCMPLRWADKVDREFQSELRISLVNQRGMLAIIARIVTDSDANIDFVNAEEKGAHHGTIHLGLSVRDRIHLAQIIKRLRVLNGIDRVVRHRA